MIDLNELDALKELGEFVRSVPQDEGNAPKPIYIRELVEGVPPIQSVEIRDDLDVWVCYLDDAIDTDHSTVSRTNVPTVNGTLSFMLFKANNKVYIIDTDGDFYADTRVIPCNAPTGVTVHDEETLINILEVYASKRDVLPKLETAEDVLDLQRAIALNFEDTIVTYKDVEFKFLYY